MEKQKRIIQQNAGLIPGGIYLLVNQLMKAPETWVTPNNRRAIYLGHREDTMLRRTVYDFAYRMLPDKTPGVIGLSSLIIENRMIEYNSEDPASFLLSDIDAQSALEGACL